MSELAQRPKHPNPCRLLYVSPAHEDFFRGLALSARHLGFDYCAYLIGIPVRGQARQLVMMSNYPQSWQKRYRRNVYFAIDPTLRQAQARGAPFTWSPALFEQASLADLSCDAKLAGLNHGWTQPIQDSHAKGKFGAFTLVRSEGAITAAELKSKLPLMQWLAQVAHAGLFQLLASRYQDRSQLQLQLSEREIVLLRMTADGMTAGEISQVVGIVERTVNFHIGNAMEKLGATNKAQAVAMAMRQGLFT